MATYADDGALQEYPGTPMVTGADAVHARMVIRCYGHNLSARIVQRLAIDNRVNDDHAVPRMFPEGRGILDLIAMHAVIIERNKWLTSHHSAILWTPSVD